MGNRKWASRPLSHPDEPLGLRRIAFLHAVAEVVPDFWTFLFANGDLDGWARRFNLDVDWVRLAGGDRLVWRGSGMRRASVPVSLLPLRSAKESPLGRKESPLPAIRWDSTLESETDFRARFEAYIFAERQRAEESGAVVDRADPQATLRDLRRLVRWHVLGESLSDIARSEIGPADPREVRHVVSDMGRALKKLHATLGLPQRVSGKRLAGARSGITP
jgi:hypothetical protein